MNSAVADLQQKERIVNSLEAIIRGKYCRKNVHAHGVVLVMSGTNPKTQYSAATF